MQTEPRSEIVYFIRLSRNDFEAAWLRLCFWFRRDSNYSRPARWVQAKKAPKGPHPLLRPVRYPQEWVLDKGSARRLDHHVFTLQGLQCRHPEVVIVAICRQRRPVRASQEAKVVKSVCDPRPFRPRSIWQKFRTGRHGLFWLWRGCRWPV